MLGWLAGGFTEKAMDLFSSEFRLTRAAATFVALLLVLGAVDVPSAWAQDDDKAEVGVAEFKRT